MLKTITIIVVVLIGTILVYAATRPDTFRVRRMTNIKAPQRRSLDSSTTCTVGAPGHPTKKRTPRKRQNMDSMVGKDFETGLASLKTIAEK
jgi:hypothetical protein